MTKITDYDSLIRVVYDETKDLTPELIAEGMKVRGSRLHLISRAIARYVAAKVASEKFGLIGVGSISFADARLAKFCAKVGL